MLMMGIIERNVILRNHVNVHTALTEAGPLVESSVSLLLKVDLSELAFLTGGRAASEAPLRLRSSTIVTLNRVENEQNVR